TYLVAIEVEEGSVLPEADWVTMAIPEHDFAVFDHKGDFTTIGETWEAIMQAKDLARDFSIPSIEKYEAGLTCDGGLAIWVATKTVQ
ncbi:hypothetical protein As57867_000809, partial [Aphanomyces stellatus]